MTNNNSHHFQKPVFSPQPYTIIDQQFPTSGIVATVPRTIIGETALLPHINPLDADNSGISRVSARQPAKPTGEWGSGRPTHTQQPQPNTHHLSHQGQVIALLQLDYRYQNESRTNTPRSGTGPQMNTSGPTNGRGEMHIDPYTTQKAFTHSERPPGGVLQDKGVLTNDRRALRQPAPPANAPRSPRTPTKSVRSQTTFVHKHKTVPLPLHVDPLLKAEVQRVAEREALSVSQVGATAVSEWVHRSLHDQHEATLYPTMRNLVREENRKLGNRLVFFQTRTAFASEQTRILTTNILSRFLKYLGIPDEIFNNLVDQSNKMAKRNIIARNPDFKSLIEQWWQTEPEEATDKKAVSKPDHKPQLNKPDRKEKRND